MYTISHTFAVGEVDYIKNVFTDMELQQLNFLTIGSKGHSMLNY